MTLRYKPIMENYVPEYVVWAVLVTIWVGCFIPVLIVVVKPLIGSGARSLRWRRRKRTSPPS